MICLVFNWLFYDPSWMLQISEFVWSLRSLTWVVLNNFLLIDATDRSKISSDQKRLFFTVSLYPLLFFANTPFKRGVFMINKGTFKTFIKNVDDNVVFQTWKKIFQKLRTGFKPLFELERQNYFSFSIWKLIIFELCRFVKKRQWRKLSELNMHQDTKTTISSVFMYIFHISEIRYSWPNGWTKLAKSFWGNPWVRKATFCKNL